MPLLLFLLIGFFFQPAWSLITREKLWPTLGLNTSIGNFYYQLEPQARLNVEPFRLDQTLTNFGGGYLFRPNLIIWLGTTWVTNQQLNLLPGKEELRLWQQAVYNTEFYPLVFTLRSRLEERRLQNFRQWNTRIRERFTLTKPLAQTIRLVIFDEIFLNFTQPIWLITRTFEQNRAYIGLDQQASPHLNVGVGYLNQYIDSRPQRRDHHVLVMSLQIFV